MIITTKVTPINAKQSHHIGSHSHRGSAGFGILLTLLISTAAALASYWTWQQSNIRDASQDRLEAGISQLLKSMEQQRETIDQRLTAQQNHQHELLQQRIIALEKKLDPAEQPLKVDRWSVAEALYLINIAEHHYSLERNATMATSALTQARQQLIKHHSDAFNPAIKQLSLAINQLKDSDREEYKQQASQLSQLSILIPDLPITHHTFVIQNSPASKDYSLQSIDGWRQYGSSLWHDLQQLFRIHRPTNLSRTEGQPITTDIHPILRQQLALKVELAKITLLSRSPLYLDTLKEIIAILNQYFDGDAEMVKSEIGRLEQMVAVAEHDLPKINFDAIRQQLPPEGN